MKIYRFLPIFGMFGLAAPFSSSNAANVGYSRTITCPTCASTSDFTQVATAENYSDGVSATYTIVSNAAPMTAYVSVTGEYVPEYNPIAGGWFMLYVPMSETPIDSSGASIASQSPTTQLGIYANIDQMVFGTSREAPIYASDAEGPLGPCLSGGFPLLPNCTDDEMGIEIEAHWSNQQWKDGDIFTVNFPTQHATVEYMLQIDPVTGKHTSTFGNAYQYGIQVDENGVPMYNTNQNPAVPPQGNLPPQNVAQLGPSGDGQTYAWIIANTGACQTTQTVYVNQVVDSAQTFFVPCPSLAQPY